MYPHDDTYPADGSEFDLAAMARAKPTGGSG